MRPTTAVPARRTPARSPRRAARRAAALVATAAAALAGSLTGHLGPQSAHAAERPAPAPLFLVTLDGPGVAGTREPLPEPLVRLRLRAEQDDVLDSVDAARPVYRWTTALTGFAVRLDKDQVATLRDDPRVALVEPNSRRRLAGSTPSVRDLQQLRTQLGSGRSTGGKGTVIGFVDTGITPRNPLFTAVPGLGRMPGRFGDACQTGEAWSADTCNPKLVAARWFVDGFGPERVRSSTSFSALDDDGHGTRIASIAAGNAGITARVRGETLGRFSGVAPEARIAAYKACWSAPDPKDDGCAVADVVTAIDRAVRDGVDVLNLSMTGGGSDDTVARALLGAAEADTVVVAAAGNRAARFTGHSAPWVTTVGAASAAVRRGEVRLDGRGAGPTLTGAMTSTRAVDEAPLVRAAQVPARGASVADARVCRPGSLDASRVDGRVVLCERGEIGRVDKSEAVRRADGAGMVLVNVAPGAVNSDLHAVPTVHLAADDGRRLRAWLDRNPDGRVSLRPAGTATGTPRAVTGSSRGNPAAAVLKPDLVAPATGLLAADPATPGWDYVSGTSAAAALTSGAAALLLAGGDRTAVQVRSALVTTAAPLTGGTDLLATGTGRARPEAATDPGLVYEVRQGDYRRWLTDRRAAELNTPSILLPAGRSTTTRTVTNRSGRASYFSSSVSGFARTQVRVTPAALRLAPGESAQFTVTADRGAAGRTPDQGFVTWRGARGTTTRIPVVLAR